MDEPAKSDADVDSAARAARRVLLVEDNDDHAELVRLALRRSGRPHELVRLEDGEQVLSYLFGPNDAASACTACALILLDLRLPRVDGIEVLRCLRARKHMMIPVVVLTTSDADDDIAAAYESGAHAYVVKPTDFASFSALIRDLACFWLGWNKLPKTS